MQNNLVATGRQIIAHRRGNAVFHIDVAAGEGALGETRRLHRLLNIKAKIDHVRNKLRVGLGLIESAHDAKRDALVAVGHEAGNDGVQRALVPGQGIGRLRIEFEESAAILQREAGAVGHQARAKFGIVALNQGDHVAVSVDHGEIGGVACGRERRLARRHVAIRPGHVD